MLSRLKLIDCGAYRINQFVWFVPDWKSYLLIQIVITESCKTENIFLDIIVWLVIPLLNVASCKNFSKLVGSWYLPSNLESNSFALLSNANEPRAEIVEVLPAESKLSVGIGFLNCFGTYNDSSSVCISFMDQRRRVCLCFSSHEGTHICLYFSNSIVWTWSIIIYYNEFKLLELLKKVSNFKSFLKIRIKLVFDSFSLSDLDPFSICILK